MQLAVLKGLKSRVLATMKSGDIEGSFELWVTRTPGYLWALFFRWLHVHPIVVTLLSIVIGAFAGYFFLFDDVWLNVVGMLLLLWANQFDCADGQLARMTGKKTLIGRILDGFAGDVWFFSIYFFICLRLSCVCAPWGSAWGVWIWLVAAYSGFVCHARQCALADYYRNVHLCYALGSEGSELTSSASVLSEMRLLGWNRVDWFHKLYLFFYVAYTRGQERQTPEFQRFKCLVEARYPGGLPMDFRERFRLHSRPLMKYANLLTFDLRVFVLFVTLFVGRPWLFFCFEIVVLEGLRCYTRYVHESFCRCFSNELAG